LVENPVGSELGTARARLPEIAEELVRSVVGSQLRCEVPQRELLQVGQFENLGETLVWVACRRIEFAPLKSRAGPKRKDWLKTQLEALSGVNCAAKFLSASCFKSASSRIWARR
jgi:hypothetical protein